MLVVHFLLVDFGWWVTILGMLVVKHPWHFTWTKFCELNVDAKCQVCSTLPFGRFWMVGDHPWDGG